MTYKDKNKEKRTKQRYYLNNREDIIKKQPNWKKNYEYHFKYRNEERGFIIHKIAEIFKPSHQQDRKKPWLPEMTRPQMWEELFLHFQFMKDLYPQSEGRLCRYCHKSWTYVTPMKTWGTGKRKITRGKKSFTNFAIDRFYNSITYRSHNIVFCCAGCNDRKHNSIPDDWKNFLRVLTEKTR